MKGAKPSLAEAKAGFKNFLASKDLKLTTEREKILEVVFAIKHHIDVAQIYDQARARFRDARISLATIYRTIPLLEEVGFLKSFHSKGDQKLYECVYGIAHHDHIICVRCGAISEFSCDSIEEEQHRVAKRLGYKLTDHRLELFGICNKCQQ